jgi:hypothetical protein
MKTIGQIRENYNQSRSASDKLEQLVMDGLLDEGKLTLVRRALRENHKTLTNAEKNALLETINVVLSDIDVSNFDDVELLDESAKNDYLSKHDPRFGSKWPTDKEAPQIIILKRKAIRVFPDNAKVALYYAQGIDKYISIPFGEIGVGSVNEQTVTHTNGKDYTWNKNTGKWHGPNGKPAKEEIQNDLMKTHKSSTYVRKQLRAGGAGPVTAALAGLASKPGLALNRAVTNTYRKIKSGITEETESDIKNRFSQRLDEKRSASDVADTAADYLVPGYSAAKEFKKGNYGAAAFDAATDVAGIAAGALTGGAGYAAAKAAGAGIKAGARGARKWVQKKLRDLAKKRAEKKRLKREKEVEDRKNKGKKDKKPGSKRGAAALAAGGLAGSALSGGGSRGGGAPDQGGSGREYSPQLQAKISRPEARDAYEGQLRVLNRKFMAQPQPTMQEQLNNITESMNFTFEDGNVTVTPSMAKNMMKVYNKVNEENKKKIEQMMNESAHTLKKFINFASRY